MWNLLVTLSPPADTGLSTSRSVTVSTELSADGCPVARLKESLSVVASGGLSRHQVAYDALSGNLMICVGDRKIKYGNVNHHSFDAQ